MPQFTEMRRPDLWEPRHAAAFPPGRLVVVGYDGSEAGRRALGRAATAAGAGGRVVIVTARFPEGWPDTESAAEAGSHEHLPLLAEAAQFLCDQGVEATTRGREGDPSAVLIETARELGAGLIVVGARGRSYLERALRGSVAEKLVAHAPCDVLVVR
jgi:nucleotide-binding universal stress UspA family protein